MVPSSCHGVVLAPGNGKCQEMLSLRMVGAPGARACVDPGQLAQAIDVFEDGPGRDPKNRHG